MTGDLWLPPSARVLDLDVVPLAAEDYGAVLGPDSAVFLMPADFGYMDVTDDRGEVPCAAVEFKPLREAILNGVAKVEMYGITQGPTVASGEVVPWPDGQLTAYLELAAYSVHVWVGDSPSEWLSRALVDGFAVAVLPAYDDGSIPYIATGPMSFREMVVVRGLRGAKVGRNEPCPCGSGIKFKRCCGERSAAA